MNSGGLAAVRRAGLSLVLFFLGCLLALGLGELTVRLVAPQQLIMLRGDIWQPADSVGWVNRPNVHTTVNTGDRTVTLVTDSNGFRVAPAGRSSGRHRVLLLGDSFMEALQVEYEQSLPGLIEQCSRTPQSSSIAVWNAAVDGWDPPQYYLQARRTLDRMPFDAVVVAVFLGNDVVTRRYLFPPREPDARRSLRLPRRLSWQELVDGVLAPVNDGLETRSHLFMFLKSRLQGLLMKVGLTALEIPTELRRDQAANPRWELTGGILADIDSLASSRGIPTLFVLIPSIEQVDTAVLRLRTQSFGVDPATLDVDQPDSLMAAELERRGLTYVSLLEPMRATRARGVVLHGRVDPHLSPEGHRAAWAVIEPYLARALGIPGATKGLPDAPCSPP